MNRILRLAAFLSSGLSALSSVPLHADTIRLANGNTIEGLVIAETPERLEIQFAQGGSITFHRDEILEIQAADGDERRALRERWAQEQEAFLAELAAQRRYEEAQRAKGLIKDAGEWVTKEEFAARTERERAEREAARLESERAARREAELLAALPRPTLTVETPAVVTVVARRPGLPRRPPRERPALALYRSAVTSVFDRILAASPAFNRY